MEKFWLSKFALILLGGGLGSVCRVYLSEVLTGRLTQQFGVLFPFGTLFVNLLGCLLIGLVAGLFEEARLISPAWRLFLVGGFMGGFTTFSTFAYESWMLGSEGALIRMTANVLLSVLGGVFGVLLGLSLARMLAARLA